MDRGEIIIAAAYFILVLVGAAFVGYMAFGRHPFYRDYDLLRRGLGFAAVLFLSGGIIHFGEGDWWTWGATAACFAAKEGILILARKWEKSRKPTLGRAEGRADEHRERRQGYAEQGTERETAGKA